MAERGTTRKRRRRVVGGFPELTSFADIAFLLIIYFILATSFHQQTGLKTDIPAGQQAKEAKTDEKIITLRDDGLFWGERQVTVPQLHAELGGLNLPQKDPNNRVVQFEAKEGVLWQSYYEVLAAIRNAGGEPGIVMETGDKKR